MEEAIKITDLGEIIQGQRLNGFANRIVRQASTATLARVWCELRPSEMEAPVVVWDSEKGTISLSVASDGNGEIAQFAALTPSQTQKIRPGIYRGDIRFRYADDHENTKDRIVLTLKGGYTKS